MPPMTMAATLPSDSPPPEELPASEPKFMGAVVVVVVVVGAVAVALVVGVVATGDAVKATTESAVGASRSPSPTLGVGKWLASDPMDALWRTAPVVGSRP